MARAHVNPETLEVGRCNAQVKCPFGGASGEENHYSTLKAAREASAQMAEKQNEPFSTVKKSVIENASENDNNVDGTNNDVKNTEEDNSLHVPGRIYLDVPFKDKNEAKASGAFWDQNMKKWYAKEWDTEALEKLQKWLPQNINDADNVNENSSKINADENTVKEAEELADDKNIRNKKSTDVDLPKTRFNGDVYLDVPFADKDAAKRLGAKWDPRYKRWYAPKDKLQRFNKWIPQNVEPTLDELLEAADDKFLSSMDKRWLQLSASQEGTKPSYLAWIAKNGDKDLIRFVLNNPDCPQAIYDDLVNSEYDDIRSWAARNGNFNAEQFAKLAEDPNENVRSATASNRKTPQHIKDMIYADFRRANEEKRRLEEEAMLATQGKFRGVGINEISRIASDPNTSEADLIELSAANFGNANQHALVSNLVFNPNTPTEALKNIYENKFLNYYRDDTFPKLMSHPNVSAEILDDVADSFSKPNAFWRLNTACAVIGNPKTSRESLRKLSTLSSVNYFDNQELQRAFFDNPNTPSEVLDKIADTFDGPFGIITHNNVEAKTLVKIFEKAKANDYDNFSRAIIREIKNSPKTPMKVLLEIASMESSDDDTDENE